MKDLKTEYTNMIEAEVPDLWSRIDSELDNIEKEETTEKKIKKFPTKKIMHFGEILVAAACLVFALVTIIPRGGHSKSFTQDAATQNHNAIAPASYAEACTEAPCSVDESYYYEAKSEVAELCEEAETDSLSEDVYLEDIIIEREIEFPYYPPESIDDISSYEFADFVMRPDGSFECNGQSFPYLSECCAIYSPTTLIYFMILDDEEYYDGDAEDIISYYVLGETEGHENLENSVLVCIYFEKDE